MELNQHQREALRDRLDSKFDGYIPAVCEMCGNASWAIAPYIMELREFGKNESEKAVIPLVSIHCTNCGNCKTFNAIALGAVDEDTGKIIDNVREVVGG